MKNFGYSVRILREARGMTAARVAAAAGISRAYLSLIEKGDRLPPRATVTKLATALRVERVLLEALLSRSAVRPRSARVRDLSASLRRLAEAESELRRKLG